MKLAGKGAAIYTKRPLRDCLEKDQCESVISEFFLSAEGGVKSFDKSVFKGRYTRR